MRAFLTLVTAFCLAAVPPPSIAAERVMRAGGDEIRLFDGPCVHGETLGRIPSAIRDDFRKAQGRIGGQAFYGCWRMLDPKTVHLIWEDGDQGIGPLSDFKEQPAA